MAAASAHDAQIAAQRAAYREAHHRFIVRLRGATVEALHRQPADGGWSAAQIGWHVATVDRRLANLLNGEAGVQLLPEGTVLRTWAEIAASLPAKIAAGKGITPPTRVSADEMFTMLGASAEKMDAGLAGLREPRATNGGIIHPVFGTVALIHIGDWAIAHTIRHNAQAKRTLG
jgi:hypothetical protein